MELIALEELETWMVVYFAIISFILGTVFGSFLNCAAWRISRNMSFVKGRSICPHCKHELSGRDLIPIISYFASGGKCRYCKEKISFRYTFIECLGGISAVISTLYAGIKLKALGIFLITAVLTVVIFIAVDKLRGVG